MSKVIDLFSHDKSKNSDTHLLIEFSKELDQLLLDAVYSNDLNAEEILTISMNRINNFYKHCNDKNLIEDKFKSDDFLNYLKNKLKKD